jgi:hypothetical protein
MSLPDAWAYSRTDLMRRLLPLLQAASQEDLHRLCRQLEGRSRCQRSGPGLGR